VSKVNWAQLMRAGMGQLRLRPPEFWALTPAELMVMLGQGAPGAPDGPMGRARLSDLLRQYPDDPGKSERMDDE